jgi:hypothetical protein
MQKEKNKLKHCTGDWKNSTENKKTNHQKYFTSVNEKTRWSMKLVDIVGKTSVEMKVKPRITEKI